MIVAVDARELTGRPTGVGRYLAELLSEWSRSAQAMHHNWRLYSHRPVDVPAPFDAGVRVLPGDGGTLWEQWTLARGVAREHADVLFAPGYTAPLTASCPTVLTVHDISFCAHPEWFTMREGMRRRTLTTWSARRAKLVLTDSEFSKREITTRLGIPAERVRTIPLGARWSNGGVVPPISSAREPVILYVGSLFRRRHVDTLMRVFAEYVAPRVPNSRLEIVGENRMYPSLDFEQLLATLPHSIKERVSLRSYVDDDTLRALYHRASVFAFLSEYEGFGFTPLEALAAGVPSVVLDTAIAREVYGPAARYVSRPVEAGPQLVDLLTNASARGEILRHADAVLGRYDWARTASATLAAIAEAAGA